MHTNTIDPRRIIPAQRILSAEQVWQYRAVPLSYGNGKLRLLMDDPDGAEEDARHVQEYVHCREIALEFVQPGELNAMMRLYFGDGETKGMDLRRKELTLRMELSSANEDEGDATGTGG